MTLAQNMVHGSLDAWLCIACWIRLILIQLPRRVLQAHFVKEASTAAEADVAMGDSDCDTPMTSDTAAEQV